MHKSDSIANLAAAMALAQAELKNPALDSVNPHFKSKFASLAGIRNTVTAVFAKHGLSILQSLSSNEKACGCSTMILHKSGEWLESDAIFVPAAKPDAQGFGSAATYARRYSQAAFINVVGDDDDDGNAASAPPKASRQASIAPNDVGKDYYASLQGDAKQKIDSAVLDLQTMVSLGDDMKASKYFYRQGSAEEMAAIWAQLDSKERGAIKRFKNEAVPA